MSDKLKLSDEIRRGDYEDFHLFILADKVLALESENEQLQKLKEFAKHKAHCQFSMSYGDDACNCGLDELLNQSK